MNFRKVIPSVGWRLACALSFFAAMAIAASAQTFTTLVDFAAFPQPDNPGTLIQGFDGNFYGVTLDGVASGQCQGNYCGTIFRMTPGGKSTTLYSFCTQAGCPDGQVPASLLQSTDGNLYGTTGLGGAGNAGTLFRIGYAGNLTTLYSFCVQSGCPDGSSPRGLVQAPDGIIYGTTSGGGANGYGTIFKTTTAGKLTTLHSFRYAEGIYPEGLILGSDGNIYGTVSQGGDVNCAFTNGFGSGCGTAFKMSLSGVLRVIYTFCVVSPGCTDGANPTGLVEGADGNLYGTTYFGGDSSSENGCGSTEDCGTLFKITSAGKLTTIHDFCSLQDDNCTYGANPNVPMVLGNDGNLYGTTFEGGLGCGVIFESTTSGTLTVLYNFPCPEGEYASANTPVQATDGTFYGTAQNGGANYDGIVYSLATGLPAFVTASPGAGKVGARIIISGTNLTGAASVTFNGTAAQYRVYAKTVILADVPLGATTGLVQVTTPSGTLTSNVAFHVIP